MVFCECNKLRFGNLLAIAAAIDRIVHHSVILAFDLPSYRTNEAHESVTSDKESQTGQNN